MEQTPNTPNPDMDEPFIPPRYMLFVALFGLIVAAAVALTQAEFTLIGWGGLGLAILSLVAWVLMAPEDAQSFFSGRNTRFSLTAIIVTLIFLTALVAVYSIIRDRQWRLDLTERDDFSLTQAAREAIQVLAADPTKPNVKIIAFYGIAQAGRRDRDQVLFDDYVNASGGKISYEFIDPDRNPLVLDTYTKPDGTKPASGNVVIAAVNEAGELDVANSEILPTFLPEDLTNAMLRVSASGDFRAYILDVQGGLSTDPAASAQGISLAEISSILTENFNWKVEEASLAEFTSPESEFKLMDTADGLVVVIPGGTAALTDEQLTSITDYLAAGGDLIVLSSLNVDSEDFGDSLATSENFSNYLWENFGLRVTNDVVLDLTSSGGNAFMPVTDNFAPDHAVSGTLQAVGGQMIFMPGTHSIEINPTPPANVVVAPIIQSSAGAFAKTDIAALARGDTNRADTDAIGPLVLAASAENTVTGARVLVYGNDAFAGIPLDTGYLNAQAMLFSMIWATGYDEFASQIDTLVPEPSVQDTPLIATESELRTINLVTVVLLPFGVLALGVFVWWRSRERETAR